MSKPEAIIQKIDLGDGREIIIETGVLAKQADGAVVVRLGEAMLLATVVSAKEAREGVDFMPLTVDYQEKYAAAGRFPGGFLKRESRLSDYEVLISRLVDRALRPLFPDDYHAETQVIINLISADPEVMPDALAGLAASAALAVSDIPFQGPISEVRVGRINGEFKINPKISELGEADIDIIVSGSLDSINMVEGQMGEVGEDDMLEAIKIAHEAIKDHCRAQNELTEKVGKTVKREYSHEENDEELKQSINDMFYDKILELSRSEMPKQDRSDSFKKLIDDYLESLPEEDETDRELVKKYYGAVKKKAMRDMVLNDRKRLDGRKLDEVRPIWSEVNYLPSAHGSAVFTRGETQSLTTITLGTKMDEQMIDGAMFQGYSKFMLHYNFPPFSTGEARFMRGPGRREIGHGNLAMRALKQVLPSIEENPYTIRVVSDILESNGSSSMATVCAGSLALMDAGIKIKGPVSGIAMGMISDKDGKYAILSDILGDEDHLGDMDFKITGTEKGITACQMDLKVEGLTYDIMKEALEQAGRGRLHILQEMNKTMSAPREDYKEFVPRIEKMTIPKEFIGAVIGSGGKVIQALQEETETTITIDEVDGEGIIEISAVSKQSIENAKKRILGLIEKPEPGKVYEGTVKEVLPFGAILEILPGKQGLLHVSEWEWKRTETVEGLVEEGDVLEVKLLEVDQRSGKLRLSRKALLPVPEGMEEQAERERSRPSGGGDRGRGGRDRDRGGRGRDDRGGRGRDDRGGRDRDRGPRRDHNNGDGSRNSGE